MLLSLLRHPNLPRIRNYVLLVLACGCLFWAGYKGVMSLRPPPHVQLQLGAGPANTRRFEVATYLTEEADDHGLFLNIAPAQNMSDNLRQWQAGQLDLAIMSSGLSIEHTEGVRVVAGLNVEPLHILVRREMLVGQSSWQAILRHRRINLGEPGTNGYQLGCELLSYLRMRPKTDQDEGDYTLLTMSKEELLRGAQSPPPRSIMPDVIFLVASTPSAIVQTLIDSQEYDLLPVPYVQSFLAGDLHHANREQGSVQRLYLEPAVIPAATYLSESPLPAADCPTIGMRSLLVAHANMPEKTVKRLMFSVFGGDFNRRIKPVSPQEIPSPFPIHPGALAYLHRDRPIVTEQGFEMAGTALSIFGAFSAGALTLFGLLRRRRIRRPEEYLEEIRQVDRMAMGTSEEARRKLDHRLVQLKEQLIHDYCSNRMSNEMVLMSILSMLADSRDLLHRHHESSTEPEAVTPPAPRKSPANDVLRNLRPAA